ncbi:MAG: hypothetical protein HYZ57_12285 [Acidobacteria bacterium]|nr:hypothetical protein [Acidobacteriota bacterium]MBI3280608.1 hypothetical protein [Acidobacteriota bacterium]
MKRILICSITALALAFGAAAQGKKGGSAKMSRVLQPQMTVETGSWEKPHGKLGEKPSQPWSQTTVAAAVDGKPNPGAKVSTVVGEIVDFSCYLQIGKHGEKHRSCAQKCFQAGQPIGLLTKDGTLYMLMEEEHDPRRDAQTDFRKTATDHAGHIMEVTGTEWSLGGYKALYVHGYLKK